MSLQASLFERKETPASFVEVCAVQAPSNCNALYPAPPAFSPRLPLPQSSSRAFVYGTYLHSATSSSTQEEAAASGDEDVDGEESKAKDSVRRDGEIGQWIIDGDETTTPARAGGSCAPLYAKDGFAQSAVVSSSSDLLEGLPGVFDIHTEPNCPLIGPQTLILTCADGTIHFLPPPAGGGENENRTSTRTMRHVISPGQLLSSSCVPGTNDTQLVATAQGGTLFQYDLTADTVIQSWEGHDFDAWTTSALVSPVDSQPCCSGWSMVSGGDDGFARAWDLRCDEPTGVWKKRHDAGVVHFAALTDTQFLCGSYDEHVYLYDQRMLGKAQGQVHVGGGGAWRLRPLRSESGWLVAVAAMQGGGSMLYLPDSDLAEGFVAASTSAQAGPDTLIYDAWLLPPSGSSSEEKEEEEEGEGTHQIEMVTCSFYEQKLQHWALDLNLTER